MNTLKMKSLYKRLAKYNNCSLNHWLTPEKGVHLFRNFPPTMCTPLQLFFLYAYMHSYCILVYALCSFNLRLTIEMHVCMRRKQLEWCTHCGQEVPKQVYALFWCKPVEHVNLVHHIGQGQSWFNTVYQLSDDYLF